MKRGRYSCELFFADCGSCSGQINYGTAKAGVTGLSKVIAKEWGPQFAVRANRYALQTSVDCPTTLYPTDCCIPVLRLAISSRGLPQQKKRAHSLQCRMVARSPWAYRKHNRMLEQALRIWTYHSGGQAQRKKPRA